MKLLNIQRVIFELNNCAFVVIGVTVVWSREDSDQLWETFTFPIAHLEPFELHLMCSDQGQQIITR